MFFYVHLYDVLCSVSLENVLSTANINNNESIIDDTLVSELQLR